MTDQSNDKSNRGFKTIGDKTLDNRSPAGPDERDTPTTPYGFVDRDGAPIDVSTKAGADKLVELMSEPSEEEIALFEDRERRGVGVGIDDTGKIVTASKEAGSQGRLNEGRRELLKELEARTEMLEVGQVADLLGVSKTEVADMEVQKRFFGYATEEGWRYPGFQLDPHNRRPYPILQRILTEAENPSPAHLMRFFLSDNWSLTSKFGDFIPGNRKMGWPATWLEFDEPRVYDLFIEEVRRDTRG